MTPEQKTSLGMAIRLLKECYDTMNHAQVFVCSREKMHPAGVHLYEKLLAELKEYVGR